MSEAYILPIVDPSGIGLLPQDTIDLLEQERGEQIDVPKSAKMDWSVVREKIAKHGMRNSNVIAIAPTATISNIMGSSPCIEPTYKNLFVKSNCQETFWYLIAIWSMISNQRDCGMLKCLTS